MTRQELENWLESKGYVRDRWGHYKANNGKVRFKMQAKSCRIEKQIHHPAGNYSPAKNEWMRMRSAFYSKLSINDKNQLSGMTL